MLKNVVIPWMTSVADGKPFLFQQDGAPAHNSNLVQNWLEENLEENMFWSKEFWPPNSPDLNPMDYYVWGVIEREVNKTFHENTDSLHAAIVDAMANMCSGHVQRACAAFRPRLEAIIKAEGSWIE